MPYGLVPYDSTPYDLAGAQRAHWQRTYGAHPGMYGPEPSAAAVHAAAVFRTAGSGGGAGGGGPARTEARKVLELGAGHGRDALFFAREGFTVHAVDFSPAGLEQLRDAARAQAEDVRRRVTTGVHDVREPLPLPDACVDAVFAHMLLCMALSTREIHALVGEVRRVLRPGGAFVYTVRHTGDAHYGTGRAHGDGIHEHGGFAVHFFDRGLVDALAEGWVLEDVHAFEEGELPRRLWRVTQRLPR
ncbi:class I SAM-dependent methyltransferase [Streptomyces varsoviensis]|uniref:class I SAM-dependent methyltransferase n=1 Tax=Streptomyces varsoviensis TaxID=67373 RepID=UPI0004C81680|nr:class I SAM-dependent methyltransferase [Streptomyces varsoviensis]